MQNTEKLKSEMIYVGCAWCKLGQIKLTKQKMIQDIQDFIVTDTNVWGGYICESCEPTQQEDKQELTNRDIETLLHEMVRMQQQ